MNRLLLFFILCFSSTLVESVSFDIEFSSVEACDDQFSYSGDWNHAEYCSRIVGWHHAGPLLYTYDATTFLEMTIAHCEDIVPGECEGMTFANPYLHTSDSGYGYGYYGIVVKSVGEMSGFGWDFYLEDQGTFWGALGISGYEGVNTLVLGSNNNQMGNGAYLTTDVDFDQFSSDLSDSSEESWTEFGFLWEELPESHVTLYINGKPFPESEPKVISVSSQPDSLPDPSWGMRLNVDLMTHCGDPTKDGIFGELQDPNAYPKSWYVRRVRYFEGATSYVTWRKEDQTSSSRTIGIALGVSIPLVLVCLVVVVVIVVVVVVVVMKKKNLQVRTRPSASTPTPAGRSGRRVKTPTGRSRADTASELDRLEKKHAAEEMGKIRVNPELFTIDMNEIQLIRQVGEGGFATVYEAKYEGMTVAFKVFRTAQLVGSSHDFIEFEREVQLVSSLSHPHLCRFFGACLKAPRCGLVIEYCAKGEIGAYVRKFPRTPFSERLRWMRDVASCCVFLHKRKIIHRDLKPDNLLLTDADQVKVIDLGLSKLQESLDQQMTQQIGTRYYLAPEVHLGGNYGPPVDVFSFGMTLFVILSGESTPFSNRKSSSGSSGGFSMEGRVASDPNFRPSSRELDQKCKGRNSWVMQLMESCWAHSPNDRPTFVQVSRKLANSHWAGE